MKILFVCSANICRSALAEVILKKMLQENGLIDIEVESAGVHDYEGSARDKIMVEYAHRAGYELGGKVKCLTQEMMDSADLIICMEHFHVVEIQKRLPYVQWNCIHLFNEICFGELTNLVDPSGDTDYIYQYFFERIKAGCEVLICKIHNKRLII